MHTAPCGTMRRSRFFLNSFLRLLGLAAAGAPAASCGSFAKFCSLPRAQPQGDRLSEFSLLLAGHHFLLGRNCALARALAGARIGVRPLAAHREVSPVAQPAIDRKSTRLNSSHGYISYAVFCLKKKKKNQEFG